MRKQLASTPLFWRVFWGNAAVLVLLAAALALGPLHASGPLGLTGSARRAWGSRSRSASCSCVRHSGPSTSWRTACAGMTRSRPASASTSTAARRSQRSPHAFNEMLDRLEAERRESTRRALMVQEGERQRVARELHDEVGQTLTGVMLQVEGLAAKIPEELRDELDELRETARSGAEDVRRIVRRLRPEALEDLGLPSALAALATAFHDQAGVRVERRLQAGLPLSEEQELVFYRVAQEALTNVARHAGASRVELQLTPCRRRAAPHGPRRRNRADPRRQRLLARHPRHARARDADRRAAHDRLGRRTAGPRSGWCFPSTGPRR